MSCCVFGHVVPEASNDSSVFVFRVMRSKKNFLGFVDPEDEGNTILSKRRKYLPDDTASTSLTTQFCFRVPEIMYCNYIEIIIMPYSFIHSFSNLSDDRSNASSKTVPPHSAI